MQKLYQWQNFFKREKLTFFIGCLVLFLGAIYPWFQLPPESLTVFHANLAITNVGRVLAALLAGIGLAFIFKFKFTNNWIAHKLRLSFWVGLIATLLFPYFIVTWSPTVAFIASSYYEQGENVSTHVDNNFSEVQAAWKQKISLNNPAPPLPTLTMLIQDSRFFQMPSWNTVLVEAFGYKNSIFTFIGRGWIFCSFGIAISLIGLYLEVADTPVFESDLMPMPINSLRKWAVLRPQFVRLNGINSKLFLNDINKLIPGTLLVIVLIIFSTIGFNIINYNLDEQFAKGNYFTVINTSKLLEKLYPAFNGNVAALERLARAEYYAQVPDPALINFIQGLEEYRDGDFQAAENDWQKSLEIKPNQFLVRGYLATAILNQGISYLDNYNDRNAAATADTFERALKVFPGHVEALYDLMLARVVNGEFSKSADVAKQIINDQKYFKEQKIGLLGQAYLHLAWAEYKNGDINKTWQSYRKSVDTKTWGESDLKEQ